jgi:hypothetical protein
MIQENIYLLLEYVPGGDLFSVIDDRNIAGQVRKPPSWPRSWANFSLLQLYSRRKAWANLHVLGQPNTFLASGERQIDIVYL